MLVDQRLSQVKEIKETDNWEEVNALVKTGWILICIYPTYQNMMYSLGRIQS
ncbi:MAG: hypothetical protein ACLTBU_16390 [Zhenhengia sp.]|uniref:hypothetical protein n=1 Tax=Zhenhengia sp. TaxID=2944208 RepID=UPI0039925DEE|nr:hypothetical protein [Clostridiales bacterium]